jgi:SlyX protein
MTDENRLIEIETKAAYQEQTISDLSDVVYEQQKEIDKLTRTLASIKTRIHELAEISPGNDAPADDKPPHY